MKINTVIKVTLPTLVLAGAITFVGIYNSKPVDAQEVAKNAVQQLESDGIEYIKTVNVDGSYTEYWRDTKNLLDRTDTRLADGTLVNQIFVLDKGSRVISIGSGDGELSGATWPVPDKFAKENEKALQKSLLTELKSDLKSDAWKHKGEGTFKNKKVTEISLEHGGREEVILVEQETGLPLKREVYETLKGQKKLVTEQTQEFHKIARDAAKDIFKPDPNIKIKQGKAFLDHSPKDLE